MNTTPEKPGIYSMARAAYDAAQGINATALKMLSHPHTPAHFRAFMDEPPSDPTDAQRYGVILHRAIFEPDTMKDAFAVKPEGMKFSTKEGMAWRDAQAGKEIVTSEQAEAIVRSVDAVWRHPVAKRMLTGSDFERSLFAEDAYGTHRKGRLDVLPKAGNVLPDLKSCTSAAPDDFEKQIYDYKYYYSAAYYLDLCKMVGIEKEHFVFIAVEKSPPYCVAVHELDPLIVEAGRKTYQRDLTVYRNCVATGVWPGYPPEVGIVSVPLWARKALEEMAA